MPPTRNNLSGTFKLSADLASLVNSSYGSDVRFLVGPDAVPMYGHSAILRCRSKYFATIFNDEWKEKAKGIVHKPNISPIVFHDVLSYLYIGNCKVIDTAYIVDLLAVAEEMELDELSRECQTKVMGILNQSIADNKENVREDFPEDEPQPNLPISFAIRSFLIPALVIAHNHALSGFLQELLNFTYSNIENVLNSKDTLDDFLDMIPYQILHLILVSDSLTLDEYKIWDLALEWACRQTKVLKLAVESLLKSNCNREDDDDSDDIEAGSASTPPNDGNLEQQARETDQTLVSDQQLKALKIRLNPLIPAIRFTLIDPEQYFQFAHVFNFFIPTRRLTELQRYIYHPNKGVRPDAPRATQAVPQSDLKAAPKKFDSNIADAPSQKSLRQWIVEAKGIDNCNSPADLKFNLLYRASIHGFQASVFHRRCDNQGPTLVLVKSSKDYLFGGVNFMSWTSQNVYATSTTNFLFTLKDRQHRHEMAVFKITRTNGQNAALNNASYGPSFGSGLDLSIANQCNTNNSTSNLGRTYTGTGASPTTLAGANSFLVADYEVFAISL